jgi:hypothetical protein
MMYGFGVPERIWNQNDSSLKDQTILVCSREGDTKFTMDKEEEDADYSKELEEIYGNKLSPSDLSFVYEEWEYGQETAEENKTE